jgi:hypothetical protein
MTYWAKNIRETDYLGRFIWEIILKWVFERNCE